MIYTKLTAHRVTESNLSVNVGALQEIQISVEYNFGISYTEDNKQAVAKIEQRIKTGNDPETFFLSVTMEGVFDCENIIDDEDKKNAHINIYNQLFPYVQAHISYLTVCAGLPALIISPDYITAENVATLS